MRWRALLVLLAALPAVGQDAMNVSPCRMDGTDCSAAGASYATLDAPSGAAANDVAVFLGSPLRLSYLTAGSALQVLRVNAAGTALEFADPAGGGITNAAGENVLAKGDAGGNLVASAISEASAGALATSAGTALGLTATAPAATTGASQAGVGVTITASPAVASTDTAGAAAGGSVTITAGAAARLTSGNANGGVVSINPGAPIGTGKRGVISGQDSAGAYYGIGLGNAYGSANLCSFIDTYGTWHGGFTAAATQQGLAMSAISAIGWAAGTTFASTKDTLVRRRAAANPAWGVASATPVGYDHDFAADGSGTNIPGGWLLTGPGNGTGTGGSGYYGRTTSYPGSTGTTANTPTHRDMLWPTWVNLTESSATSFSKLTFAASTAVGAEWFVTVSANDGTDFQSLTSRVRVSSVRAAAGDAVSAINVVGTDLLAATSGTLACTFTEVDAADGVAVAANCESSLTQTVLRLSWQAVVNGPATVGAP